MTAPDEALPAAPTVLVSSRDVSDWPRIPAAVRIVKAATEHGWTVTPTFAVADVPDAFYLNGHLKTAAHRVHSIAIRIARGEDRGWAIWHSIEAVDGGDWRFDVAYVAGQRLWLLAGKNRRPTVAKRLTVKP